MQYPVAKHAYSLKRLRPVIPIPVEVVDLQPAAAFT
jgi:hypothetical protein